MLENQLLMRQAAAENGVSVTEDEVDAAVEQARSSYESDGDWAQYLAAQALTEQGFREQTELSLLGDKLAQVVAPDASDDAERQTELSAYMNDYRDADIHEEFLPDDAPYYIDLAPYEEAARLANPDASSDEEG